VVESQPSKLLVAGSIPVSRSSLRHTLTGFAAAAGQPWRWPRKRALGVQRLKQPADWTARARAFRIGDLSAEAAGDASVQRRPM
jgi:hypothetical protein